MKKLVMTVAVLACAASIVSAQVTSVNIVGYNKTTQAGLTLVSVDFDYDATGVTPEAVYGSTLPVGSKIYTYTPGVGYSTSEYVDSFGSQFWTADPTIKVGEGFWYSSISGQEWVATRPFTP